MRARRDAPQSLTQSDGSARVVALCGGIGGAKLALGLEAVLGAGCLTVVVNSGDDFEHLGLHVSPDLDTVLYTLAGLSDAARGWGRAGESWHCMEALAELGGDSWFALGDRDLAVHIERTRRLRAGETLTAITAHFARQLNVASRIVPMTDLPVRTAVHTSIGVLPFQEYFVRHRCAPAVTGVSFTGAAGARMNPALDEVLAEPNLAAVVICPSNPYLSIDPILAVPGMREALRAAAAPVVAVSPLIGGQAVKGPTAKIMAELGIAINSASIAAHYRGLIDGLIVDTADAGDRNAIDVPVECCDTLMRTIADKRRVAAAALALADLLAGSHEPARPQAGCAT